MLSPEEKETRTPRVGGGELFLGSAGGCSEPLSAPVGAPRADSGS